LRKENKNRGPRQNPRFQQRNAPPRRRKQIVVVSVVIQNYVPSVDRISAVLQREPAGNVQEGDELAGDVELPGRGAHQRGGPRRDNQVLLRVGPAVGNERTGH